MDKSEAEAWRDQVRKFRVEADWLRDLIRDAHAALDRAGVPPLDTRHSPEVLRPRIEGLVAEVERLRVITTEQDAERRAIKKTLGLLGGGIGLTLSQEVERLRTLAWDLWADEAPVDAERVRALLGRA